MRKFVHLFGVIGLVAGAAVAAETPTDDAIDAIIRRMRIEGDQFQAAELQSYGPEGAERVLDRLMELTSAQVGRQPYLLGPSSRYAKGFARYARQVNDRGRQTALARAAARGYATGSPFGDRRVILNEAALAAVRSLDDNVIDELTPLLTHKDEWIALTVVRQLGQARAGNSRYFPNLFLAALASNRERVVEEVIRDAPNCWDPKKARALRDALRKIFAGDNEHLKFQACFPLIHDFRDAAAIGYLVEQTRSDDPERLETALRWLGDACNSSTTASPEIVAALQAHLHSPDPDLHRQAADSLAIYRGRAVLEILVDLLVDSDPEAVRLVQSALLRRASPKNPERAVITAIATERVRNSSNEALRTQCERLLKELDSPTPRPW